MDSFDEYRTRWVYKCPMCGEETTAFRDCGQLIACKCGGNQQLSAKLEPKHIEYDGECNINVHTFQPYFDVTMGKVVNSKHEISEYCKRNNMVYAGDKELSQQCKQNKSELEHKQSVQFIDGLTQELSRVL